MKNYYTILEISASATNSTIKNAYRKLAKEWHPDLNADCEIAENWFREVKEAYETLSDNNKKAIYDFRLKKAMLSKRVIQLAKPVNKPTQKNDNASLEDFQKRLESLTRKHQSLILKNKKMAEYYRSKEEKAKTFYDTFRENREQAFQAMKSNISQKVTHFG